MDADKAKIRELEDKIKKLDRRLGYISDIYQLQSTATISDIIIVVNKITSNIKRKI